MNRKKSDLLVRCGVLVTQDETRSIYHDGGLAVVDGRVEHVGEWQEVRSGHDADEILDLSGHLVLPGLVNTHTHAAMTLFRGLGDDLPLMRWLTERIWPMEKQLTPELVKLGTLAACCEMVATGTTCFADMYVHARQSAEAAAQVGMRCAPMDGLLGSATLSYQTLEGGMELVESLLRDWRMDSGNIPMVRPVVMVHTVHTASREMLARSFELAERNDTPWMIHLAESNGELQRSRDMYGVPSFEILEELGITGNRVTLIHGVHLTPGEMERAGAAGMSVAHNPVSNAKLANGMAPVEQMQRAGINVALGTDGAASNNNLNLFKEMQAAALTAKVLAGSPEALPAQTVLDMATLNGARCLAWPGIGSLAPGHAADLCALDMSRANLRPLYNPVSNAVYAATGGEVCLTMVGGRVVYRDRTFAGVDYPALIQELRNAAQILASRQG